MSEFKSWAPEVIADSTGKWCNNGLRFTTEAEAIGNVNDLMLRWFAVREVRAVQSEDMPNYRWIKGYRDETKGWVLGHLEPLVPCSHVWELDEDEIEVCSSCGEERGEGR